MAERFDPKKLVDGKPIQIAADSVQPFGLLYAEARDAMVKCIVNERDMKQMVIDQRQELLDTQRLCDEIKADAIVNAEDETDGIFVHAGATNDRARRAAIDMWEASNPGYLAALNERDKRRVILQQYEADYVVCIRSLAALRLDMEYAIAMIGAIGGTA